MRSFTIFFSTVLLIYLGMNFYVLWHLQRAFPSVKGTLALLWILGALVFPLGRIFRPSLPEEWSFVIFFAGGIFLAVLIHALFAGVLWDLFKGGMRIFSGRWPTPKETHGFWFFAGAVILALLFWGYGNTTTLGTHTLNLRAHSPGIETEKTYRIAFLSDIHAGRVVGEKKLALMASRVRELSPDLVILGGDILENPPEVGDAVGFPQTMQALQAPLGLYGVAGNHEYYANLARDTAYLESCGISLLRDEVIVVDGSFLLLGRNDAQAPRFGDTHKHPKEILATLEEEYRGYPLLVANHTPTKEDFRQAVESGVLLQLSGHTHNGQIFPFNFVTGALFPKSWGLLTSGDTNLYVSSGAGTWGPPIRTNSVSEVVLINLRLVPGEDL
jgi:predicted MPP superfamily phosphohydrolase